MLAFPYGMTYHRGGEELASTLRKVEKMENLTLEELEIMRQALYSKAYKMESEINKSYSKTGPSARLDKKGAELDKVIALMNKVNNETLIKMGLKVGA